MALPYGGGRIRLRLSVSAEVSFWGRQETAAAIEAALTSAGLGVAMTSGKRPRKKIAFGPPLSLGMSSDAEYADITLSDAVDDVVFEVNAHLVSGIVIKSAKRLGNAAPSLMALIAELAYELTVPASVAGHQEIEEQVEHFARQTIFQVQKITPDKTKTVDLARGVRKLKVVESSEAHTRLVLTAATNDPNGHNANPSQVLNRVLKLDEEAQSNCQIMRVAAFSSDGSNIDAALRTVKRSGLLHSKRQEFIRFIDS